jgi:hypothetical protein
MGRPLNKKLFGNRNVGSASTTADNGIGGGAVASVSAGTVGNFVVTNTYQNFPTLTASAPTLPGGVTALLTPVYELDTVTYTSGGQTDADYVAGLSTSITGLGGGAVVNIVEVANKVTEVNLTGGNRGEFRRGDFTGSGITTHQVLQAPNAGTDLQITVTYRVKRIEVAEAGSGYVAAPTLTWGGHTFTGQTAPSAQTVTMLVDNGIVGTVANQENAIVAYAYHTGGSLLVGDITKQVSTDRYKVKNATATATAKLKSTIATAAGEMNIVAIDTDGKTYYVTKLTAHRAQLVPAAVARLGTSAGTIWASGSSAPWSFASASTGYVQIENA